MEISRQYLGWDRPFTLLFAERLREEAGSARSLDDVLIWVPSARAGRHILAELFTGDPGETEAFHPPRLVTPAQFVRSLKSGARNAGDTMRLFAWKQVLLDAGPGVLEPVFPVVPEVHREAWAYGVARQFLRLRERLAEDMRDFRSIAGESLVFDRDRWRALGQLEADYLRALESAGLADPDLALAEGMGERFCSLPWRRLIVAGVLNLSRRQAACVEALNRAGLAVDFYLPAPEDRAGQFDEWGRPAKQTWEREPLPETLLQDRLQRSSEPRELVQKTLELAEVYADTVDALVVGAPGEDVRDYLIERSRLSCTPFYAPEGKTLGATSWGRLLTLLSEWHNGASVDTALELLRHSLFRNWAHARGIPVGRVEQALLGLRKERLIQSLPQINDPAFGPDSRIATVREFGDPFRTLLRDSGGVGFAGWIWGILHAVATAGELPDEAREVLGTLEEQLQDLQADFAGQAPSDADYWELLRYLLESGQHYPEREAAERPVSGWLELPWETAPHLVVLGLPDSEVPGPDSTDSFLTPSLCRDLGLYGPDEVVAFHAFRLRLLLESRKEWGRLDILVSDRGLDDAPVLPCRFLFLAPEADILARVQRLLGEQAVPESSLPTEFGARLRLPPPPDLDSMSVTGFGAWLASPVRFYLERLLRWEAPQPLPREMDALHFGSLAHRVLEAVNRDGEARDLVEVRAITDRIEARLDEEVGRAFGSRPAVPVRIQTESLRERLRAAARVIANERRAGWRPVKVEWAFHDEIDFRVGGVPLRGKIDLLEENAQTGELRIIDYKTTDKSDGPAKAHWLQPNARSAEPPFPECDFMAGDKRRRWKDLQLPLYQLAVRKLRGKPPRCGYLCLTKAVRDVRLEEWTPGPEEAAAAMACAEAIIRLIRAGRFPLDGLSRHEDPWLPWFGGDYRSTLDPEWLQQHAGVKP
ncbi:MAG: PD-(D/E)XK nuclease family protein [Oceanipulchritudo sp.]